MFTDLVFIPRGKPLDEVFNLWRGFDVAPKRGDYPLLKAHIRDIICGGNSELEEYFYNWVAYTIQNPDKPAGSVLVFQGEKGSGKGIVGHFLKTLWGEHGKHITNPKHLTGSFNKHLASTCLLFADEVFASNNKRYESVLKSLITEPELIIEGKGVDAVQQKNYLKIVMATNEAWEVPVSKDERQFCVYSVSSAKIKDRNYFSKLTDECDSEDAMAAFLFDMQNRDISGFHTGDIPESLGLQNQRLHSLPSWAMWLLECLKSGSFGKINGSTAWPNKVSSVDLYNLYLDWHKKHGVSCTGKRVSQIVFSRNLGKVYAKTLLTSSRLSGFIFGSLEEAISQFETSLRVSLSDIH